MLGDSTPSDSAEPDPGTREPRAQSGNRRLKDEDAGADSAVRESTRVFSFVDEDGRKHSVSGLAACIRLCQWGVIRQNTVIKEDQDYAWKEAREIPELSGCFSQNPNMPRMGEGLSMPSRQEDGHVGARRPLIPPRSDTGAYHPKPGISSGSRGTNYFGYMARCTLMALAVVFALVACVLSYAFIPVRGFIPGFLRFGILGWFVVSVWKWTKRFAGER